LDQSAATGAEKNDDNWSPISRRTRAPVIGKWEKEDVVELLSTGTTPAQGKVKGAMRETLQDGLKYLSDFDLDAIADYLFAQPPIVHEVRPKRQLARAGAPIIAGSPNRHGALNFPGGRAPQ
jgi:hypothetical protein